MKQKELQGGALVLQHIARTGRMDQELKEAQDAREANRPGLALKEAKLHLANLAQQSFRADGGIAQAHPNASVQRVQVEHIHRIVGEHHFVFHPPLMPHQGYSVAAMPSSRWDDPNVVEMDPGDQSQPPLLTI